MPILNIFSKNIETTYKSTVFSKATFIVLLLGIFSIMIPFILAYMSKGFWLKRDIFYEQPNVKFKGDYWFLATTNNLSHPVICSSFPHFGQNVEYLDMCHSIKVRELDHNFDFKVDELQLTLQLILPQHIYLTSLTFIIELDYKLTMVCPLQMQSVIILQEFLPITVKDYMIMGDVKIVQSSPLHCSANNIINNIYNYSIIKAARHVDYHILNNIIAEYSKRNVSTKLLNIYTSFTSGNSQIITLNFNLKYVEDQLFYKPGFWHVMKWAWIQYYTIYIIISYFIIKIKTYIFNKRLVLCYENSLKKNK